MPEFRLPRTGLPEIEFSGDLLIDVPGEDPDGRTGGRRHDVSLYETDDDRFLLAISYHSPFPSESSIHFVEAVSSIQEFDDLLSLCSPTKFIERKMFRHENDYNALARTLTQRYDFQVEQAIEAVKRAKAARNSSE